MILTQEGVHIFLQQSYVLWLEHVKGASIVSQILAMSKPVSVALARHRHSALSWSTA
ncbi:hypothetical protein RGR602_CH01951 [Rhizobium gallicum bv. gallicum R602sp]|uniref:Uncharacterized protein n=1 Tax=Rhizobium gallicum bv. gallicum R602sp TaxID=1041138 RepID=A0A0B4X286_9HYPH|nr:hypothetical protein RGR602_CH01951 [Rhizobium gallicum bv. gallicum R602sp]